MFEYEMNSVHVGLKQERTSAAARWLDKLCLTKPATMLLESPVRIVMCKGKYLNRKLRPLTAHD